MRSAHTRDLISYLIARHDHVPSSSPRVTLILMSSRDASHKAEPNDRSGSDATPAASRKPWEHAKSAGGSGGDPLAARFVESLSYDRRLYKHDIAGSIAHARMLRHVGLISDEDLQQIERGLGEIRGGDRSGVGGPGRRAVVGLADGA